MSNQLRARASSSISEQHVSAGPHFAVGIDVSGGVTDELIRRFLDGVTGFCSRYEGFVLDVWGFDTRIDGARRFTSQTVGDLRSMIFRCGGGTLFEANWDYMRQVSLKPERLILFTDGYPGAGWGDSDYCDTVFVIHSNRIVAPFGRTLFFDDFVKQMTLGAHLFP